MDTVPEVSRRVFSFAEMSGIDTYSSGYYSFLFLKLVSLTGVWLETVELGLHSCS